MLTKAEERPDRNIPLTFIRQVVYCCPASFWSYFGLGEQAWWNNCRPDSQD
ncbi:MAG: hypothetical protein WCK34_01200 [Bacteroidota bacterium]